MTASAVSEGSQPSQTLITYKEHDFVKTTYNGFELITHKQTLYINATKLCHEVSLKEGKKIKEFKNIKQSPQFLDYIDFLHEFSSAEIQPTPEMEKFLIKPSNFGLVENITGKGYNNDIKGVYIHPKLINCVLTLTSIKYLKIVSELMDTINEQIHEQLKINNQPDTPTNAQPIFQHIIEQHRFVSDEENNLCYGYREHGDKLDYLNSYDKAFVSQEFDKFKQALQVVNLSLNELKRDYPQILD